MRNGNARVRAVMGAAVMALGLLSGCESGPKLPPYEAPKLSAGEVATMEGTAGTYITVIDEHKVSTGLELADWGGNTVRLTPGRHRISVRQTKQGYSVTMGGPVQATSVSQRSASWEGDVKAGHKYEIGPMNRWNPFGDQKLVVKDKTDGTIVR